MNTVITTPTVERQFLDYFQFFKVVEIRLTAEWSILYNAKFSKVVLTQLADWLNFNQYPLSWVLSSFSWVLGKVEI